MTNDKNIQFIKPLREVLKLVIESLTPEDLDEMNLNNSNDRASISVIKLSDSKLMNMNITILLLQKININLLGSLGFVSLKITPFSDAKITDILNVAKARLTLEIPTLKNNYDD